MPEPSTYAEMARENAEAARKLEPELRAARTLRDAAIRRAHETGTSQLALARLTGLSRAHVQRICDLSKARGDR